MAKNKDGNEEPEKPAPAPEVKSLQIAERQPIDLEAEGHKGNTYIHKTQKDKDGKPISGKLKVVPEELGHFGRTHIVKGQTHTWTGTQDDFRDQFEKE